MENTASYEEVCKYVGQFFLESRHHIQVIKSSADTAVEELRAKAEKLERERDDALRLISRKQDI